jgi:hypothetical protein
LVLEKFIRRQYLVSIRKSKEMSTKIVMRTSIMDYINIIYINKYTYINIYKLKLKLIIIYFSFSTKNIKIVKNHFFFIDFAFEFIYFFKNIIKGF